MVFGILGKYLGRSQMSWERKNLYRQKIIEMSSTENFEQEVVRTIKAFSNWEV